MVLACVYYAQVGPDLQPLPPRRQELFINNIRFESPTERQYVLSEFIRTVNLGAWWLSPYASLCVCAPTCRLQSLPPMVVRGLRCVVGARRPAGQCNGQRDGLVLRAA
jgi:hypothetical protein